MGPTLAQRRPFQRLLPSILNMVPMLQANKCILSNPSLPTRAWLRWRLYQCINRSSCQLGRFYLPAEKKEKKRKRKWINKNSTKPSPRLSLVHFFCLRLSLYLARASRILAFTLHLGNRLHVSGAKNPSTGKKTASRDPRGGRLLSSVALHIDSFCRKLLDENKVLVCALHVSLAAADSSHVTNALEAFALAPNLND